MYVSLYNHIKEFLSFYCYISWLVWLKTIIIQCCVFKEFWYNSICMMKFCCWERVTFRHNSMQWLDCLYWFDNCLFWQFLRVLVLFISLRTTIRGWGICASLDLAYKESKFLYIITLSNLLLSKSKSWNITVIWRLNNNLLHLF